MDFQNILLIITFAISLFLSIFVYFHKSEKTKEGKLNIIFAILSLDISFWIGSMFFFRQSVDSNQIFIILKILYTVPVFMPVLFLYFVLVFNKTILVFSKKLIKSVLFISACIIFLITIFTDKFIIDASIPVYGEKIITFGSLYGLYAAYLLATFGVAYSLLIREYILSKDLTLKSKLKYLFIGTFFPSMLGMLTNLILPWFGYFELNWLGNVLTVFFVGFLAYAIIRYKLLNIKMVTAEFLIFSIIIILLIQIFLAQSVPELIIKSFIVVLITIFGFLLIRGVYKEIELRERAKKLAGEISMANKELRRLEKQKTEFVSIASHQLRTPLTAIKGYASMLLEGSFGKISSGVREAVEKIYKSNQVLVIIIDDFLMVSRIEQGRMVYDFNTVELSDIVKEVVKEVEPDAEGKGLKIQINIEYNESFIINADYTKMKQVIHNIFNNAIRYTEKGFIKILLSKNQKSKKLRIAISDTGMGIKKEMIPKLFKKFSKGRESKLGSGIGLYVAKEIVNAHTGRIWAQSDGSGRGTTFFIELPEAKKSD